MEIISDILSLRLRLKREPHVVFVPTMGNLHEGHLSLIQIAKQKAGCLVASIFVNRLQFSQAEEFDQYPRTLTEDCRLLEKYGVDHPWKLKEFQESRKMVWLEKYKVEYPSQSDVVKEKTKRTNNKSIHS